MSKIVDISDVDKASSGSVIRLRPLLGQTNSFYADFDSLLLAVHGIATGAPVHLSGPSGTGKSHFLSSLLFGPAENFVRVCTGIDVPRWHRIKCHRIYVSSFETPNEIFYRTEVVNFSTEDRRQPILNILTEAVGDPQTLHVVWLVESGRSISPSIQGGFLEVVGTGIIREPRGEVFQTTNVTFVTDSNYVANESGEFVIVDLDQAYARRWTRRMTFAGLPAEHEAMILRELSPGALAQHIQQVVALCIGVRQKRLEGALQSILPPTIDVELDLLRCLSDLPLSSRSLVFNTVLGHCSKQDQDEAETVYAEAFGVRVRTDSPAAEAVGLL